MTITSWKRNSTGVVGGSYESSNLYRNSTDSPRVNGKLRLRNNPLSEQKVDVTLWRPGASTLYAGAVRKANDASSGGSPPPNFSWSSVDNVAYSKYRGKLYKGSASLGVTLGSWKQSRDMITHRFNDLGRGFDRTISRLEKDKKRVDRLRREREPLAGQILEAEFGWRPLVGDVIAALTTACEGSIPDEVVSARHKVAVYHRELYTAASNSAGERGHREWAGTCQTTYSSTVKITNPNLWLLNRMGLINLPAVALDLVPWSFVVTMCSNLSNVVNQFTDYVGLDVSSHSITRTSRLLLEHRTWNVSDPTAVGFSIRNVKNKNRVLGTALRPKFEWRVPDLNWELCMIAGSLVVQKIDRINRIIRLI